MAGTMNLHVLGPERNYYVSMESGLDGRNNMRVGGTLQALNLRLNGVRPRWPEQLKDMPIAYIRRPPSQWSPA